MAVASFVTLFVVNTASADLLGTGYFSGTLVRYNETTQELSTFAAIDMGVDAFPGLSGLAYNASEDRVYASARESDRIYSFDGTSGAMLGFHQLETGYRPTGMTFDSSGQLYVARNAGNTVDVFDSTFGVVNTISLPDIGIGDNLPSGLAFDNQDRLLISTFAGGGVFRYDPSSQVTSPLAANPLANNQIAVDANGNFYVGGAAFSSSVQKFDADGNQIDSLLIDASVLPEPSLSYDSPDFTSPSGVVVDEDGNLIVAALGRTNPFLASDNFQNNGGLFKFSPDGTLLETYGTQITPLSSVTVVPNAVPEPGMVGAMAIGSVFLGFYLIRRRALRRRLLPCSTPLHG